MCTLKPHDIDILTVRIYRTFRWIWFLNGTFVVHFVRSGLVRSECLTCTFRASCCSARLSRAQVPAFCRRTRPFIDFYSSLLGERCSFVVQLSVRRIDLSMVDSLHGRTLIKIRGRGGGGGAVFFLETYL